MASIRQSMSDDHHACDSLFAEAEANVTKEIWGTADIRFGRFHDAIVKHFAAEEQILFPLFEARTGVRDGPTRVMRSEHDQMRAVLDSMSVALAERDATTFLGLSDTLWLLMQQHNLKEETMLYPSLDSLLGADEPAIGDVLRLLPRAS